MIGLLPLDLFRFLVEDHLYLDAKQATSLDVAFCNHKLRAELLLPLLRVAKVKVPISKHFNSWQAYLHWLGSRSVRVTMLTISVAVFAEEVALVHPVRAEILQITGCNTIPHDIIPCVISFVRHFPNLRLLCCWQNLTNQELLALEGAGRDGDEDESEDEGGAEVGGVLPEGLHLLNCEVISSSTVTHVACRMGDRLRKLYFHALEDEDALAIAENCQCLTHLVTNCPMHIENLLTTSSNTLQNISFRQFIPSDRVNETLQQVSKCTQLRYLLMFCDARYTGPIATAVLRNCPLLHTLTLLGVVIKVGKGADGLRTTQIAHSRMNEGQIEDAHFDHTDLLITFPMPIQSYTMTFGARQHTADSSLGALGERFELESTLEVLDIELKWNKCAIPGIVRKLLWNCSNLIHVRISLWSRTILMDDLPVLPMACPRLCLLTIYGGLTLTDRNLAPLLQAFRSTPADLDALAFTDHCKYTDLTLTAIAELFPNLFTFITMSPKTGKRTLLRLLLTGKLTAKRIKTFRDDARWIVDQLLRKGVHCKLEGEDAIVLSL